MKNVGIIALSAALIAGAHAAHAVMQFTNQSIFDAIVNNDILYMQQLCKEVSFNPDDPIDTDSTTPLYIAAQNGHTEIVRLLVNAKANVNRARNNGTTPLFIAAHNGHTEIVRLLVNAKADVNQADNLGMTPLYIAAQNGHTETIKLLVNAKANVNRARNNGTTPLTIAAHSGHTEIVRLLLNAKADVNQADNNGTTPLTIAAQNGHTEIVRLLVNAKADVNQAAFNGITPLIVAAQNGHTEIVRLLVNAKADVNQAAFNGITPLIIAAQNGHTEIVKLLLWWGVNIQNLPLKDLTSQQVTLNNISYTAEECAAHCRTNNLFRQNTRDNKKRAINNGRLYCEHLLKYAYQTVQDYYEDNKNELKPLLENARKDQFHFNLSKRFRNQEFMDIKVKEEGKDLKRKYNDDTIQVIKKKK